MLSRLLFAFFFALPIALFSQSVSLSGTDIGEALPQNRTCATHEKHVEMMGLQKYAEARQRIDDHRALHAPLIAEQRANGQSVVITIPIVFHVLYANSTENIADSEIFEQLQTLNDDFRRLNSDADNVWSQAADTEIEFCLATIDPDGAPTNGILRVPTSVSSFGSNNAMKFTDQGGSDAWPASDYLNFWVCNLGGGLLGYAQFPGGSASTDGVVCGYPYVGSNGPGAGIYNLGRTGTHEVGHWLDLRHIWGDGGCGVDDGVSDTPESDASNFNCAIGHESCGSEDMVQNYMDYSQDACMNLFTAGQAVRMQALFQPGGDRASLLNSNGCAPQCEVSCGCTDDTACNFDSNALNDDGTCDFSCYGCTEPSACNYDDQATINDGSCVTGDQSAIEFNLTPDDYGSETTWSIADDNGSTVLSGGPYTNGNTATITASANLDPGCYTLTVNDSYGDGICCTYGTGSYSLTQCGIEITSGGSFASSETFDFCVSASSVTGCTDASACNYNSAATTDDGSCAVDDACGVCGGPGAIYECGCTDIPAGDCDCAGNQEDDCGVCGGPGIPAGDCDCNGNQLDAIGVCGGTCSADVDDDDICDDVDDCVGSVDAIGVCGGDCTADVDGDGICDNEDDCIGQLDALGVCNGDCAADANNDGVCDDDTYVPTTPCENGFAGVYPCDQVDFMSHLVPGEVGGGEMNDIWGWTDPLDDKEYALLGRTSGTAFIDITDPNNPVYLGDLPTHTVNSSWRDIKVYADHAFIVSEASGHGMQVFDLTRLRNVSAPPVTFDNDAHYSGFGSAHNIAINEESGRAYPIGASTFSGGLNIIDISNPLNPTLIGSYAEDGYSHDAQIVNYIGPDTQYAGKEIAFCFNENTVTIVDVTDAGDAQLISSQGYSGSSYTHQGWLTEDHKHLLVNDELDEQNSGNNTRTYIFDVQDLDNISLIGTHSGPTSAIDHNLYNHQGLSYQSNYRAGLRILDLDNVAQGTLEEVAYFDVYPSSNSANFNGTWSNYPFFASGNVIVSHIEEGLFVLRPNIAPPCLESCGCTDPTACNYDDAALNEDGSCDFGCYGCTDPTACNYDPSATIGDNSCVAPNPEFGCDCSTEGSLTATLSGGEESTPLEFEAIANPAASSVDVTVEFTGSGSSWPADMVMTISDGAGNCVAFGGYNSSPAGCPSLGDYNAIWPSSWNSSNAGSYSATVDLSAANLENSGTWSLTLYNGWSTGGTVTYEVSWSIQDACPGSGGPDVPGCTDSNACNYDATATSDNGSCLYEDALGECGGDCSADVDDDGVCDTDEVPGCTNPEADNYNSNATDDDGSCTFAPDCPGDFDGNGIVGVNDVLIALGEFGCQGVCEADLDGDNIVGVNDILTILSGFGQPCL